jgi:hypothetical protein
MADIPFDLSDGHVEIIDPLPVEYRGDLPVRTSWQFLSKLKCSVLKHFEMVEDEALPDGCESHRVEARLVRSRPNDFPGSILMALGVVPDLHVTAT